MISSSLLSYMGKHVQPLANYSPLQFDGIIKFSLKGNCFLQAEVSIWQGFKHLRSCSHGLSRVVGLFKY